MTMIWATRGRNWGFRFLDDGGFDDPLSHYEDAFSVVGTDSEVFQRTHDGAVVRFFDPEGRTDRAGRTIPHDLVLSGTLAEQVNSVDDALRVLWPIIAGVYERVWELTKAPSADELWK